MSPSPIVSLEQNGLLASIEPEARRHLGTAGTIVELPLGGLLRRVDHHAEHVWFPLSGMLSLTIPLQDGTTVEAGLVGREGVVGLFSLLRNCEPADEALVQLPGQALRVDCNAVRELMQRDQSMVLAILRCSHDLFVLVAQTAVCNVRHDLLQRLARWVLLSHDRSDGDTMPLTQEILSIMLGVQRNSVTVAAQNLRQHGAIHYARGRLTVTNRSRLEELSCECYEAVRSRLAGGDSSGGAAPQSGGHA